MRNDAPPNEHRLEVVSHHPGRLRVRARVFRVLPEVAKDVAAHLNEDPAVLGVEMSPVTGSMVIAYDPLRLELTRLVARLVQIAGLHGIRSDTSEETLARAPQGARLQKRIASYNDALRRLTTDSVDLRTAVPGTLAAGGLAILLFGRRRIPEWYDLMFWGFVTFVNLNSTGAAPGGADHDRRHPL
jgi:hypothetical protein